MELFRCVKGFGVVQVMTNLHLAPFPRPVSSLVADYPLEQGHKGWQVRCHPNSSPITFPALPAQRPLILSSNAHQLTLMPCVGGHYCSSVALSHASSRQSSDQSMMCIVCKASQTERVATNGACIGREVIQTCRAGTLGLAVIRVQRGIACWPLLPF